jgi:plastocyanin
MPARLRLAARLAAPLVAAAPVVLAAPPAGALVQWQVVTARNTFVPSEITVLAGDTLVLTNVDLERHDVTALDTIGGNPMFRSATIGPGQQAQVVGVANLAPSVYPFYCSVHEWMTGNLTVL